jgi:hypothetical protein
VAVTQRLRTTAQEYKKEGQLWLGFSHLFFPIKTLVLALMGRNILKQSL